MDPRLEPRRKPWAGILVGCGLLAVMVLSCLALTVVPSFLRFGSKSKSSEVKSSLKAAFTAEKSYWYEKDAYSETIEQMGFLPERGNRYLYLVSHRSDPLTQGAPDGGQHGGVFADEARVPGANNRALLAGIPSWLLAEAGVRCEADGGCDVTIVAAGNIDGDATVDVWSISTKDRVIGSEPVRAGTPWNHVNDVER